MKIDIIKSRVIFKPENADEKAKLEAIWRILVDCVGDSRKLVPIGEYVPQKDSKGASFHIEGLEPDEVSYAEVSVEEDAVAYCKKCSKIVNLKKEDFVPLCCGKMMDIID